ncbi:MAG: hypothetical protein MJ003_06150 [Paludibacteraceae bacterium]|nr:hypothetical protein [Paludibacteraceae bacterium]
MKRIILFLIAAMAVSTACMASSKSKADKDTQKWRYEIECAGTGTAGTYLVKVWSYSKKQATATNQAVKNAVHGVMFKGVAGGRGCATQRAMVTDPSVQSAKEDFFNRFFADGGDFQKYGSATGVPEVVKVGKEYKVGVVVSVYKDNLRKDLESAGIIRGLSSGF